MEVSAFGLAPECALSVSDSPAELQRAHKDALFATVTAHPHERGKSNTNFSISELGAFS